MEFTACRSAGLGTKRGETSSTGSEIQATALSAECNETESCCGILLRMGPIHTVRDDDDSLCRIFTNPPAFLFIAGVALNGNRLSDR